jgi:hypothetical protein
LKIKKQKNLKNGFVSLIFNNIQGFESPEYEEKDLSKSEDGKNLIFGFPHGSTMFHIAAGLGEKDLIKKLLDNKKSKPNLNLQNINGETFDSFFF